VGGDEVSRKPAKTLEQLAREAEQPQGQHQFSCKRCGCKMTRVVKTWYIEGGAVRRKRVCHNCGQDFTHTTEVPCPTGFKVVVEDEEERACA
jgi:DNA-directed RNA polymerase subunit RPC12/RpoP